SPALTVPSFNFPDRAAYAGCLPPLWERGKRVLPRLRITSVAVNHDHVGIRRLCKQALDRGGAALERKPLVDVALVGDLARIDRGYVVEQQHAGDAHRRAPLLGIPFREGLAHVLGDRRMAGELRQGRRRWRADEALAARGIEPGQEPRAIAALTGNDAVL